MNRRTLALLSLLAVVLLAGLGYVGARLKSWLAPPPLVGPSIPVTREFVPALVGTELVPGPRVRPGDRFSLTLRFENRGTRPSARQEVVFVHFERPTAGCKSIAFQADHELRVPTTAWMPGERIVDGPRLMPVPLDLPPGEYVIHVGLFDREGEGARSCSAEAGRLRVTPTAQPSADWKPTPLLASEVEQRRAALRARLLEPVQLQGRGWRFALDRRSGAYLLEDEHTGVLWSSNPSGSTFGRLRLSRGERVFEVPVPRFDAIEVLDGALLARAALRPVGADWTAALRIRAALASGGAGLRLSWELDLPPGCVLQHITLLEHAFMTTDVEGGYTLAPAWLGQLKPATGVLPHDRWYGVDDVSMAMSGAVKQGSALLVSWLHPDASLVTHATLEDSPLVAGRRAQSLSLVLGPKAHEIEIRPLGAGGYVEIARAYRELARERGFLSTWAEKRARQPELELLEGAAEFRFACLSRLAPGTRHNRSAQVVSRVGATFDEVARCARHWREDLGIERAQILLSGWNRDGYDNGHPDILPANPECGGDAALVDCACEVRRLGFLFTLHDNYVDIYTDSDSWDPEHVVRGPDGELKEGGEWLGGRAFRVCGERQLAFARRNLPELRARFQPQAVFLDSTLTCQLSSCSHPGHRMDSWDDLRLRRALFEYARGEIGLVGLEGGREWAVPEAHWFEGMLTQKTVHMPGWDVVPLFELVYGDCVGLLPMQADRLGTRDARKLLDLVLSGQMPSYAFDSHAYFERARSTTPAIVPEVSSFEPVSGTAFRLKLRWKVNRQPASDADVFVHFTRSGAKDLEGTVFQADHLPTLPLSAWRAGDLVETGGALVRIPAGEAEEEEWEVRVGLAQGAQRIDLDGLDGDNGRVGLGVVRRVDGRLSFEPSVRGADACFARADQGWAAEFCSTDRMIKNSWEVLSWLNRLVLARGMTGHRYLDERRQVEQSVFGDVVVTANYGARPVEIEGTVLPEFGFLVRAPGFVAFHATRFSGLEYPEGALFTLRALDGGTLEQAREIRVFHGFGDPRVKVAGQVVEVRREAVVEGPGAR